MLIFILVYSSLLPSSFAPYLWSSFFFSSVADYINCFIYNAFRYLRRFVIFYAIKIIPFLILHTVNGGQWDRQRVYETHHFISRISIDELNFGNLDCAT